MSGFERITIGSLLQKLVSIVVVALIMAPPAANAESLLLLHNAGGNHLVAEAVNPPVRRPMDICLDENGDLVIRQSNVTLTLAHTPPDEIIERLRIAQRQDCPPLSGISLKISFLF
ncbi:MAG: hypothetical protein ACYDG4_13940 [Desulfuromonadaceae bacterium]